MPGIVGPQPAVVQDVAYDVEPDAWVVMHSDGLTDKWDLETYPGLQSCSPLVVAATLLRDAAVRRDDASVLVCRGPAMTDDVDAGQLLRLEIRDDTTSSRSGTPAGEVAVAARRRPPDQVRLATVAQRGRPSRCSAAGGGAVTFELDRARRCSVRS